MKSLILAEKPSVAREIARVLNLRQVRKHSIEGKKYIVTWALGHLVELKMPEHYDPKYKTWRLEDLPIIPKKMGLKVIRQTSHQFKGIESLSKRKDIGEIIIATDAGREGELVARWILEKIRWRKPIKRLWISSVTDRAIRDGFKHLKPGEQFENLYQSAVCRAEADWLIGLNVSRALTTKYQDPLSAGRVQTPTLSLIMDREKQIQSFVPKPYWTIHVKIGSLDAQWEKNGENRLFSKELADMIFQKIKKSPATIRSIDRKQKVEHQPLPYDLNELQRDANRRFGFSAKKTLNILQNLYERHKLVTYPRTDSRYLTTDMEGTMLERLQGLVDAYSEEVRPLLNKKDHVLAKKVFNNARVTDHHAIIPTEERANLNALDSDERKIYDLIVRRFLTLFYPVFKYETVHVIFDIQGETFIAKDRFIIDQGFKSVTGSVENYETQNTFHGKIGQTFHVQMPEVKEKLTEPPLRFTEADLLGHMEKYGLGTPATRADIIERLLETEVVERQKGRLYPTPKGKQLIDLVNDELKSPKLTAKWEEELERIARGKADPNVFLKKIRKQTEKLVLEIKTSEKTYRAFNLTGSKCPECGSFLKERNTKDGKILVCSNFSCSYKKRKDPKLSNRRCPQCHKRMEIHQGAAGTYFQCRPCNIVEKAEKQKKTVSKWEEKKLVKKYAKKEDFGTNLGELLKAALDDQNDQ
ncbi:DNA topoisomerase III [Fervidibacillus halotolerans]|uniref:DNA topoisomerase n=1 Tax=Fervidibacillus halotolerans TaxID=2980027 RepID=A0A9E8RY85_9BACI|nr:DNA topoisomerase III [Fervidibacillus halotolerans]WAA12586.1 DNA topoisomerase III [Fervidibacillus halotolerans]